MSLSLQPGNALGCAINAHRHGWNGSICENAASWNCGADASFREDYCERKDPRCFHIQCFDAAAARLVIPQSGAGWLLESDPTALNDQILLLWGGQYQEPRGQREGQGRSFQMYGAYRVQSVEKTYAGSMVQYVVHPYPDGWTEFASLRVPRPYYTTAGGPYLKQVDRRVAERVFREALEAADREWKDMPDMAQRHARLQAFARRLGPWQRDAEERMSKLAARHAMPMLSPVGAPSNRAFRPFTKILESRIVTAEPEPRKPVVERIETRQKETDAPFPLVEPAMRDSVATRYGEDALTAILVGSLTKPIVVFRGEPGVGKSALALQLIDDPDRERTLVVPVSSTWRGREDLLGYVNPVDHVFEPTNFTRFLYEAEAAWDQDNRRNRLVVFEEFNLSQPEYWLSDIIVRSQYPAENRKERTIELGGLKVRGLAGANPAGVYLAPSVRFVATINTDSTTRPLSPRVLDRLAVIGLSITPRNALSQVGLTLSEDQELAITEIDYILRQRGGGFSLRAARSLKECRDRLEVLHITPADALDLVLLQEVLTKVRLLAGDPADHRFIRQLMTWNESHGATLRRCSETISVWKEMLEDGRDVVQV